MRTLTKTMAFYPVTAVYLAGVAVAIGITAQLIELSSGVLVLTAIAFLAVLLSMFREVQVVHYLLDIQRNELLGRIAELVESLHEAGVETPGLKTDTTTSRETSSESEPT